MKKLLLLSLLLALLALPAHALVITVPFDATGTNGQQSIDTSTYREAVVTISGASASGTVTVYVESIRGDRVAVATYATPTTAKTYIGPTGYRLVVTLTGNTTGTATCTVGLR